MLRVILLSLVWAICSTCLVRPWFWKCVINKTLFQKSYDEKRVGFIKNSNFELVMEIFVKCKIKLIEKFKIKLIEFYQFF